MRLTQGSVSDLLAALASPDPTPGGGSASALVGAAGASLLVMVASLPKTRGGFTEDRTALDTARRRLVPLAAELAALVDRDAEAYDEVVAAYRLPKGTEGEKAARTQAIQRALAGAIDTPLAMLRAARGAAAEAVVVARHGNPSAASDVTVALELLRAASNGALVNVEINLGGLGDQARASRARDEAARLHSDTESDIAGARAAVAP
jgi:glutamate formiminotransferase/formiminotetrahydrofolate cyclodeaminase